MALASALGKVPLQTGLRRLFYVVSPDETSFESLDEVPPYIAEAYPFFVGFLTVEIFVSLLRNDGNLRINDGLTSTAAGLFSRLPGVLFRSVNVIFYTWVFKNCHLVDLPWNSPWTWWLCLLGVDFCYYWLHRLSHEVNFLWASHQVHHSSEDYNLTTALRQSFLQSYVTWMFYLPLAIAVPPSVFAVHNEFNILYQFWIHTQYIKSLGPLEYIMNTPSHHRVHHGRNRYCIDKNFGGTLIIWDRIFGTFEPESEEIAYGLTHPVGTFDLWSVQFSYFKYLLDRCSEVKGVTNKLQVLLKGPGWLPGKPRLGNIEDIPAGWDIQIQLGWIPCIAISAISQVSSEHPLYLVELPAKKYTKDIPLWYSVYVLLHFIIVVIIFQVLVISKSKLSQLSLLGSLGFIGFSLTCFGHIFDNKPTAPFLELFRCLMYITVLATLKIIGIHSPVSLPAFFTILQVTFAVSALMWLAKIAKSTEDFKKAK